ncbi:DUF1631 family protein [Ramlibacter humi]|uniref:DUF1631 family protein n=1 Tax=Ramlibacter humi TaxID=2530451 RepID=A0A4Z0BR20_9BURK|nr:DUF1631 family protein [Ramlibacter humi]TFZ01747.1 DUF1631 family protein [Ramlibacter humi]
MADLPAVVRPCINEAVARAARMAERAAEKAAEALDQEALAQAGSSADWRELQAAGRELLRLKKQWHDTFPRLLRQVLESAAPPKSDPATPLRHSSLSLVDDAEMAQSVDTSRLAQLLLPLVEQPLAELDALMTAALGLDGVQSDRNPLRPEVIAGAMRKLMAESAQQSPAWMALWMRFMAEPLAHDLSQLYLASSKLLTRAGVRAADYRVVAAPESRASRPAPLEPSTSSGFGPAANQDGVGGAAPASPGWSVAQVSHWLHNAFSALRGPVVRDFLRGGADAARRLPVHQPLDAGYYQRVQEELAALEARADEPGPAPQDPRLHAHLAPEDRPSVTLGTETALSAERWGAFAAPRQRSLVRTRLKQQAQQVGQAMGLEVVRQLVDEVAQDQRLLPAVREAIVALEPALARLAMHAPQFFGNAEHPARLLVESVAVRSFQYNDETDTAFETFYEPVRKAFNRLNRLESIEDPSPFEVALAALEEAWEQQDRAQEEECGRVMEAVKFAERRQADAEQIAWDLSHRTDLEGSPALVQDFLFSTWSLVLAHARMSNAAGAVDPGGFLAVVSHLLWSSKRELLLRDPAHAFEVIPRVLVKVREGLTLIGHPEHESASFFSALEKLHRPVMKLRARSRQQAWPSPPTLGPVDDELEPAAAQKPRAGEDMWLAPGELQVCGFNDTVPSDYAPLFPHVDDDAPAQPLRDEDAEAIVAALQDGSWVDLYSRQKWRRAQLVWSGTRGTLFMFVSEGRAPHSMTKRSLLRLVATRMLRLVDTGEVVRPALDALAQPVPEAIAA